MQNHFEGKKLFTVRKTFLFLLWSLLVCNFSCKGPAPSKVEKHKKAAETSQKKVVGKRVGKLIVKDPRFYELVDRAAEIEVLCSGFKWTEGPVWVPQGKYLLFSDIPNNAVFRWKEGEGCSLYLKPSGYTGKDPRRGEMGSNGLALDPKGRLVLCQHGDRRVAVMDAPLSEPRPKFLTLASSYEGKRLNSPNDLVFRSDGSLYFTDPPYGLEKGEKDPAKELPFQGVYRLTPDGKLTLLTKELTRPNGIGFSPDEKILYVANSDPNLPVWFAFDVQKDGTIKNKRIFHDSSPWRKDMKGLPDGLVVDTKGNLFATGPGGVCVFAPDGTLLGIIFTGQATSNCAWGDDGSVLYMTCDDYLMRVRTKTKGPIP